MRRLAVTTLVTFAAAAAALLVIGAAQGCGPTPLAKAWAEYDGKAEAILQREDAAWRKLAGLLKDQLAAESPDTTGFDTAVRGECVPFYDKLKDDVAAVAPAHEGLAEAHGALVKFAAKRAEFAHVVEAGLDLYGSGDPARRLDKKDAAFRAALADYAQRLQGRMEPPDQRFAVVQAAERDLERLCFEPLSDGRRTGDQVREIVKTVIQPRVKEARDSKFEDDAEGRAVRAAVVAMDEFLDAVQQELGRIEASARLSRDTATLAKDGDAFLQKFKDEMKAVRGRM
jgi:hypothetical protein